MKKLEKFLTVLMNNLALYLGKPYVFAGLFLLAASWFAVRPFLEYDTWYDIMDVFIFLSTFFLLFVVQSSQNADTKAIQDKLDAIVDAIPGASDKLEGEEKKLKRGEKR